MALQLRRVLAGVAVGGTGDRGQHLVDGGTVGAQQSAVDQPATLAGGQGTPAGGAEHGGRGLDSALSADADDANGAGNRGCGNGGNGFGHAFTS